jgi:hypothetical protein
VAGEGGHRVQGPGDEGASTDVVEDPRVTHLQFVYKRPTVTAGPEHAAFPLDVSNPHVRLLSWQKADEIFTLCAPTAEEEVWKIFSTVQMHRHTRDVTSILSLWRDIGWTKTDCVFLSRFWERERISSAFYGFGAQFICGFPKNDQAQRSTSTPAQAHAGPRWRAVQVPT